MDLHSKPFDSGTLAKLDIFEDYAQAWIPTFVMLRMPEIHIFDFFSGPGYDCTGAPGSPIRLLQKTREYKDIFLQMGTKIVLHLNEFEPNKRTQSKFETLCNNCQEFLGQDIVVGTYLTVKYYNESAEKLFFELLPKIRQYPSLVYLDQNGIKFIADRYISELEKLEMTDFLYFVSSSYFKRLGKTEEFKRVLFFDSEELANEKQTNMHRLVANRIKEKLPANTELKLFPYSIKKGANVYGIIFGAKHYRAVDKFLKIAWERNKLNGEADFDIDDDVYNAGYDLFGRKGVTKVEKFQADLEEKLSTGRLKDNKEALLFAYQSGHIPDHAKEIIKKLKGSVLTYVGRTDGVNYDNVFKRKNIVAYKLIK